MSRQVKVDDPSLEKPPQVEDSSKGGGRDVGFAPSGEEVAVSLGKYV